MQQLSTNTFTASRWIVSADPTQGTHTTIQGAINASSAGDGIIIRSGTYTEDITLISGIDVKGARGDGVTPIVTIIGNVTYTGTGNATISEVRLQTNGGFLVTVSGANASVLHILSADLHCTNNTGISFTNSNAASQILVESCTGNLTTTGIAFHSMSSVGALTYRYTSFNNTGASVTASTNSAGTVNILYANLLSPFATSGTGVVISSYSLIDTSAQNVTAFTTAGTGTSTLRYNDSLSGTASALSIGTGSKINLFGGLINSTNANAITGLGTIKYASVAFVNSGTTLNVTTQNPVPFTVPEGGTNASTFVAFAPIAGGTTATSSLQSVVSVGTSGQVLTSNGAGALSTFQAVSAAGATTSFATGSGAATPAAGVITIAGTANQITTTGSGSTVTIAVPTSPSFAGTTTAATGLTATSGAITATSGNVVITAGNLTLPATTTTTGQVIIGGNRFMHDYSDVGSTYVGSLAGNLTNTGTNNTGVGSQSLLTLAAGGNNTSVGYLSTKFLTSGSNNTALGFGALFQLGTGSSNICIGELAGEDYTGAESNNIIIAAGGVGVLGESNVTRIGNGQTTCFISGISGATVTGTAVLCSAAGQLGTIASSLRYKDNVKKMAVPTKTMMSLRPVEFHYKTDEKKAKQYGLIAEEVEKTLPFLVVYNEKGQPESVKYHDLPVLLLNELQKQHKIITALTERIKTLESH
jgi:hypothetical protein